MPSGIATLSLSIVLSERCGAQFSTETGRWASFRGSLQSSQSSLDGTTFFLEVFEGDYGKAIQKSRDQDASHPIPEIAEASIGVVNVTPHAQSSDHSKWPAAKAPFHAMVHLAPSDFDAALRLVDVSFDEGQLVSATLTIRSDQSYPEIERSGYPVLRIDDIDLSDGFQGFVFEFRVNRSLVRRIPIRLPEKPDAKKPAARISIVVSSVYIDYNMPRGYVGRLICEGHIKSGYGARADQLDGSECSIEFGEYDLADDGLYPKEALSGKFTWHKDVRSLSVDLQYRDVDLTGPLASLIFAGASDFVRVEMT
jgi:hypothetical protein